MERGRGAIRRTTGHVEDSVRRVPRRSRHLSKFSRIPNITGNCESSAHPEFRSIRLRTLRPLPFLPPHPIPGPPFAPPIAALAVTSLIYS